MKNSVKFKGKLRSYMCWPLYLSVVWICLDIIICKYDTTAGAILIGFTILYMFLVAFLYTRSKSVLMNEIVNFATQYATVQKQLLNEFEVPYALLDHSGKFMWINEQFSIITGVDKVYKKSVTTLFPSVTRELLQKNQVIQNQYINYKDKTFRISVKRIYMESIANESNEIIDPNGTDEFLNVKTSARVRIHGQTNIQNAVY